MSLFRIALANLRFPATPEESVRLTEQAIKEAARKEARIVCFPECYVPGYRGPGKTVPPPDPPFLEHAWSAVAAAAAKANIAVVLGTERVVEGALLATALVIHPDGSLAGFQDKVQIDPSEEGTYTPGSDRSVFQDELMAAGAEPVDAAADLAWYTPAGWGIRFHSGMVVRVCSRILLYWTVRRRLSALPQVRFVPDCEVTGLLANTDRTAVSGVTCRSRSHSGSEKQFEADLVVDASGRNSRMSQWLEVLGYPAPQETVVNALLGYATRMYRRPGGFQADWKGMFIQAAPPGRTRGGVILPIEDGRWMVTLGGGGGDYPPTDEQGFLEFARSLVSPRLYDAFEQAEALSPITGYRATENRQRHYERLSRWPERCIVVGDAACCFNPVYGQGMTTAALGAMTLDGLFRESEGWQEGMGRRFQRRLAQVNEVPWLLATSEDYRYRTTVGKPTGWFTSLMHSYMSHVLKRGTESVYVRRRLLEVFHMLRRPGSLFHPRILAEVAWSRIRSPRRSVEPQPLGSVESDAAKIQEKIDALRRGK